MKKIYLVGKYSEKFALVDDIDYELVSSLRWSYCNGYAVNKKYVKGSGRKNQKSLVISMHRFILGNPLGKFVDHIDFNTLNNKRENIRVCDKSDNQHHQGKMNKATSSKYKGVFWNTSLKKWMVKLQFKYKCHYVGIFDDEIVAAKSYDKKAKELFGEFAWLNFP